MKRVAHRLAGVVSGALVIGAFALPMAAANAASPQAAAATSSVAQPATSGCVIPDNPIWGDGCRS